ncbi:MAG: SurA N-terminal domain-containing protein [Desulfobacterales bacterium]
MGWVLALVMVLSWCNGWSSGWSREALARELVDRIVAVVNEEVIALVDLNQKLKPYIGRIRQMDLAMDQERQMIFKVRQDVLDKMIDDRLTDQQIRQFNIMIEPQEIDEAIERFKEAKAITDEQLRQGLETEGMSFDQFQESMREQILRIKLVNQQIKSRIVITDNDVQAYYEAHPEEFGGGAQVHLRNLVLLPPEGDDSQALTRQEALIKTIFAELDGGRPFAEVAAQYSQSSLAASGGDLGQFNPEDLAPNIRQAVADLSPGQYSPVVPTDQGLQIFYIEDRMAAQAKPLEGVAAAIETKLYNEIVNTKFEAWLAELRAQAHIKIIQ